MPVTVEGAKEAAAALKELSTILEKDVAATFKDMEPSMLQAARGNTPVLTGFLQSQNFTLVKTNTEMEFGNKAGYAGYVEHGTDKMPARPFWSPVIDILTRTFGKKFVQKLEKDMK